MIPKSKIRTKFLLFIIVLAVVPVLVLGTLTFWALFSYHQYNVSELETQLIDQKIKEIEKFFSGTMGILEIKVGFTQKSDIELSQQLFLLDGLLAENSAFQEVSFINLDGKETAKKARTDVELELFDVSRLEKFKQVSQGKNYISDVYYTLSGPFITLAAPVYNRNNEIIQFISSEVSLSQIRDLVKSAVLGSSGYLLLLDSNGFLAAQGLSNNIGIGTSLDFMDRVRRILAGQTLDGLNVRDRYQSFASNLPVVGAGKKIQELNWVLLVEWPVAEADLIIKQVRNQVILFTLFGVLAVLVLTPFFAQHLASPVRKLQVGVKEIEKGNFEHYVEIKTKDELEELGSAFNEMAKGLKRLQELKDEFVFIAAHELRAPVTVIRGYISMLLEGEGGELSKEAKEMLIPVMKSGDGLNRLVDDLLQVARSEAGRIEIKVMPCDIKEVIKNTADGLSLLAREKSIILIYEPQDGLPKVLADQDKLAEVMKNLIDNAIKYTVGSGRVVIYHEIKDNILITSVKDTGIGIPKEKQEKLFQKFFRVKTQETQDIQGTGLGLWLVKQLIEKMNGKIWVVSEQGKGSIFSFSLPLA